MVRLDLVINGKEACKLERNWENLHSLVYSRLSPCEAEPPRLLGVYRRDRTFGVRGPGTGLHDGGRRRCLSLLASERAEGSVSFFDALAAVVTVVGESNDRRTKFFAIEALLKRSRIH